MNHVRLLLGGLDDDVAVKLTPGVQLPPTVRTVADLLAQPAWPTGSGSRSNGERHSSGERPSLR
jgi:hypothetical protein